MKQTSWFGLAALLAAAPLYGRECRGIAFPERVTVQGATLALNGLGVRKATIFKVNVYVAALYVVSPSQDAHSLLRESGPSELVLQFVRSVSAKELRERWTEGLEKNSKGRIAGAELARRVAMLNGWMTDIDSGQRMTFVKTGAGISVDVNGSAKGTIPGEDFSQLFLSIWLGEDPPNPELKSGLLGGRCE
jgi:hypothetical protein